MWIMDYMGAPWNFDIINHMIHTFHEQFTPEEQVRCLGLLYREYDAYK